MLFSFVKSKIHHFSFFFLPNLPLESSFFLLFLFWHYCIDSIVGFFQHISAVLHRILLVHIQLPAHLPFKDNSKKIFAKSWVGTLILLAKAFLSSSFPSHALRISSFEFKFLISLSWSGSMTYLIKPKIHNQVNSFDSISIW